jgi:hypothetical protein
MMQKDKPQETRPPAPPSALPDADNLGGETAVPRRESEDEEAATLLGEHTLTSATEANAAEPKHVAEQAYQELTQSTLQTLADPDDNEREEESHNSRPKASNESPTMARLAPAEPYRTEPGSSEGPSLESLLKEWTTLYD